MLVSSRSVLIPTVQALVLPRLISIMRKQALVLRYLVLIIEKQMVAQTRATRVPTNPAARPLALPSGLGLRPRAT